MPSPHPRGQYGTSVSNTSVTDPTQASVRCGPNPDRKSRALDRDQLFGRLIASRQALGDGPTDSLLRLLRQRYLLCCRIRAGHGTMQRVRQSHCRRRCPASPTGREVSLARTGRPTQGDHVAPLLRSERAFYRVQSGDE